MVSALLLSACNQQAEQQVEATVEPAEPAAEAAQLSSGLKLENMDTSVKPGDDFNLYVNGTWMANTEIPADKPSYSIGRIIHDESQEAVKAIIEQSASGNFAQGTDEQKVGDLYASYMDLEARNTRGIEPLAKPFAEIDALADYSDLAHFFGRAVKYQVSVPFVLFIEPDMKAPEQYNLYAYQTGLGLPDREYYFEDSEKSAEIREKYVAHIAKMFELAGVDGGEAAADSIMALETRIAEAHMVKEEARNWAENYNKQDLAGLAELMPDFDWAAFLEGAGTPERKEMIILQTSYHRALNDIFKDNGLDAWKTYLKWGVINASSSMLNEELDAQNFDFYSRTLSGVEEQQPLWRRGVGVVNGSVGEIVGKVYVKEHFPPEAKDRMMELVNNLIKAYEASINDLDWMGDETKAEALDKLHKFTPKIGYPDIWRDYTALEIDPEDLFGNMSRSAEVAYNYEINKLDGPILRHEWGMTPQTVNAYYNPTMNEIVFPAAILQPPFFDMNADDAVNYGSIGAVIGHEIGHGFDNRGSTFDGDGALRNWWTDEDDRAEYDKRTGALVAQYDAFQVFDDLNVNGTFTLGENIGDLGGLHIALKAYKMSLNGEEAPVMDGFTGEQRVFLGYGQGWLGKSREESLRRQVKTDPHSPRQFRVNGVVRNIPEFYSAFNVGEGDALYLPPEERVKIW
jgi:putative endopeptidase